MSDSNKHAGLSTRMIHTGRAPKKQGGAVNPPIHRASTLIMDSAEDLYGAKRTYGLAGLQVHDQLKDALNTLEGAKFCTLTASGLLACTLPIFALCEAGGEVLIPDNVYGPTRRYCDRSLKRTGGRAIYYDPRIGSDIDGLITDKTRLIFMESPGSLTFEIQDTRAIVEVAKARKVPTATDNSWAAGVYHHPLDLGVDFSLLATTKYAGGHADSLSGAILTNNARLHARIEEASRDLGLCLAPEDASIVLRGLRTMETRMRQHETSAIAVAEWLLKHPKVADVLHPALPHHPDHSLWRRDFTGSSGLFGVVLKPCSEASVLEFLNTLELFGLGFSYGGYESLAIHCDPQLDRTATTPDFGGPLLRLSVGLEAVDDLKADLEQSLSRV